MDEEESFNSNAFVLDAPLTMSSCENDDDEEGESMFMVMTRISIN